MLKNKPYKRHQPVIKDPDRKCTICGNEYKAVAPLQKTCSKECRLVKNKKSREFFYSHNPEKQAEYRATKLAKNPDLWKNKYRRERLAIISKLGGKCVACGHNNPLHLHIDYIPTMVGTGYRHPRHKKWVLDHIKDFRLLCANHHYELTCTGKIEGTDIIQQRHNDKK